MVTDASTTDGRGRGDLVDDVRQMADDAGRLVQNAKQSGMDARALISEHPYAALATAATAGFVLGGGLSPAIVRVAIGLAGRAALASLIGTAAAIVNPDTSGESQR